MLCTKQPTRIKLSQYNMLTRLVCAWVCFFSTFTLLGNSVTDPTTSAVIIPNKGQWDSQVIAKIPLNNGDFWITYKGFKWLEWNSNQLEELHHDRFGKHTVSAAVTFLNFNQANPSFNISFEGDSTSEVYNFFKGNDPNKWKSNIKKYSKLVCKNIWTGVKLEIYTTSNGIKYNWIGTTESCKNISYTIIGSELMANRDNELNFLNAIGSWKEILPISWKMQNQELKRIGIKYNVKKHLSSSIPTNRIEVTYDFPLDINNSDSLIIDPILVFSTYSGSRADNFGCTGTYDNWGNGFAGGTVFDFGLPVTPGAIQINFGGGEDEDLGYGGDRDAAILKFSSAGNQLLFCTYLGGEGNEQPHSMVADSLGNLYVMGSTKSDFFPITNSAYKTKKSGDYDFFISKFNNSGTVLLGSTYIGGKGLDAVGADRSLTSVDDFPLIYNYADEFRGEIITDQKYVYVAGVTSSIDFPRTSSRAFGGKSDGVVFCLNSDLSQLKWSEEFGSTGYDAFYGLALGKNNQLYVAGGSSSTDLNRFPNFGSYNGGEADGILLRYDNRDGNLLGGTYYGTNKYDQAYFVQTDPAGFPHIYGQTEGSIPSQKNPRFFLPNTPQFLASFSTDLTSINWQSCFGATNNGVIMPNLSPSAFLIDRCGRLFVSGWGGTTNQHLVDVFTFQPKKHRNKGNTRNMPLTADAAQKSTDGSDFYVAVFSKNMYSLAYATYFGGVTSGSRTAEEHVDGGTSRFDAKGIIYQSVCAGCRQNGLFPTTPSAYSRTMNSDNCNNALFKIDFENLNLKPFLKDTFIQVVATQSINVKLVAKDPDPSDTLFTYVTILKKGGMNNDDTIQIANKFGVGTADLSLIWNTICTSWSLDTVVLKVMVYDRGCPKADTTYWTIKILVTEPPKVIPPATICVSFDRQTSKMNIAWPSTVVPANFFKYYLLQKTNPNGTSETIDTIWNNQAGNFIDGNIINPRLNNYCYELIGVNRCDIRVFSLQKFCSVTELNTPIKGVELYTTTIQQDKFAEIRWGKSFEPDFKEFELYRYKRGDTPGKLPFAITTDTFYRDSTFNPDLDSYCYSIIVTDQCGHISNLSNEGCNVVLEGSVIGAPNYSFPIWWMNYQGWLDGVRDWEVERMDDGHPFSSIQAGYLNRSLVDKNLDYDWGGYWYRVKAKRNKPGDLTQTLSESNWIYLFQKPEVWVPTGITRNKDGLNDIWGTFPVFVREYSMLVYDRWGNILWESNQKKNQWDATVFGKDLPDGVYAWKVDFWGWDNKKYTKTGTVTVIH